MSRDALFNRSAHSHASSRRSRLARHLGLGLAGMMATVALAAPALADKTPHQLHVQANATIDVAPDQATLNARLWELTPAQVQGEESSGDSDAIKTARDRLESRTGELIRTLENAGIDSQQIRAGSLSVRPDIVQAGTRGDDDSPSKVRTRIERSVSLTLNDLDRLPRVLDALTTAGVDSLDGVSYGLQDSDAADDRALKQALERARQKAEMMADTLNVDLGDVVNIEETTAPRYQPQMMMRAAEADSASSAEYRSGEISIDAGVSVTWEIDD
ncbi:SIMPL domain-containing protein [Salinicola acroporae]|uniref:SIMPL domain-containing protein n=1 Tax=Salinicola acroporae TaxID=1541440 RepID=A0ABT6I565_9GAMM|nr:SIMPL domain-containing protein [Salinicola acroporae]MDH4572808.1 SIMPL domain-containing protein [Salinicola acroporae]